MAKQHKKSIGIGGKDDSKRPGQKRDMGLTGVDSGLTASSEIGLFTQALSQFEATLADLSFYRAQISPQFGC